MKKSKNSPFCQLKIQGTIPPPPPSPQKKRRGEFQLICPGPRCGKLVDDQSVSGPPLPGFWYQTPANCWEKSGRQSYHHYWLDAKGSDWAMRTYLHQVRTGGERKKEKNRREENNYKKKEKREKEEMDKRRRKDEEK